jgi:hypothetical protein
MDDTTEKEKAERKITATLKAEIRKNEDRLAVLERKLVNKIVIPRFIFMNIFLNGIFLMDIIWL